MNKFFSENIPLDKANSPNILPSFMEDIPKNNPLFNQKSLQNEETLMIIQIYTNCPICFRKLASLFCPKEFSNITKIYIK